jgi:triosephosphate isomerase
MRTPIIAGNWKMNNTVKETKALLTALVPLVKDAQCEVVVCVPFTDLQAAKRIIKGTNIKLGAQNVAFAEKGAYTGEISVLMLQDLVDYVIVGHSERRQYFGEADDLVNRKVRMVLSHGLKPIVCIGENLEQNEAGRTEEIVSGQVNGTLSGIDRGQMSNVVISYEPVWAIGTGRPSTAEGANQIIGMIRNIIQGMYGDDVAKGLRIQYGGSVRAGNIAEYLRQPEIDGALVGGASIKADEFVSIVRQAAEIRGRA